MHILWHLISELALTAGALLASRTLLHSFQLESYQFPGYRKTVLRTWKRTVLPGVILWAAVTLLTLAAMLTGQEWLTALVLSAASVTGGYLVFMQAKKAPAKKKLAYTPRMKRLHVVCAVVYMLLGMPDYVQGLGNYLVLPLLFLLLPVFMALGGLLAWPIEKGISELYFRDAQRILREHKDLIRIGITGSYGKTSVKFILGTLLQEKFNTLVTPSSFNTPMGVTKVIRTQLTPAHQVFVAEMGARHVGDIKEMCRLVHPRYGVLTSVGPQHLDTFKTLERIKSTKYELMDAIPEDGICFFPDDGAICRELYDKTTKPRSLATIHGNQADVWAENVTVSSHGSRFLLCTGSEKIECETKMLGEHTIQNITLAASVCLKLGMTMTQLKRGIAKLKPVEHRLQLMETASGMTIIDDAFNSNPAGSSRALDVLAAFEGRRIIITPGMVELGEKEAEYNREFGLKMASSVDIAILVGRKHSQPIREGLLRGGFKESDIYTVASLNEAGALLRTIGRKGDTVLFENDLPDNYTE